MTKTWADKKSVLAIQYIMASIGGYMGAYTLTAGLRFFGNSQTANLIELTQSIVNTSQNDSAFHLIGLIIYILGLVLATVLPKKIGKTAMLLSPIIDISAFISMAILEHSQHQMLIVCIAFFAMSFQWVSFPEINGYSSSTIFSTNNLRQCVTAFTEYLCTHDKEMKHKGLYYLGTLISYNLSAGLYFVLSCFFDNAILFGIFISAIAFFVIFSTNKNRK